MATSYGPLITTNNLRLYLDAASKKSYPGTGTIWNDLSGRGNNGTLVNGVGYNNDNLGSLVFDGVNDYVVINSVVTNKPFTISIWCYVTSVKNQALYVSRTIIGEGISIFILSTGNIIRFDTGAISNQWTTGYGVPLNTWVNIVLTVDDTHKSLFINGELNSSIEFTGSINNVSTTSATLGASNVNGASFNNFLSGRIASYNIYNKALTPQEIQQNFNTMKGRFGL